MNTPLKPLKDNLTLYLKTPPFSTMTVWKNDVDAFFNESGKCGQHLLQVLENLRSSKDLSKKDKKARVDSMLFSTLPKKYALVGSKLFALTILFKGNLPTGNDIFQLRQEVDKESLAKIEAILAQF
jgi:hypothetical protein